MSEQFKSKFDQLSAACDRSIKADKDCSLEIEAIFNRAIRQIDDLASIDPDDIRPLTVDQAAHRIFVKCQGFRTKVRRDEFSLTYRALLEIPALQATMIPEAISVFTGKNSKYENLKAKLMDAKTVRFQYMQPEIAVAE